VIGSTIGPFEVEAFVGRGGMGEVYRAKDTRLGRDVALKILPPEFAADPDRMARFEREARMLAVLQHQNIASIYGLETHEGRPVLIMELAEGEDLSVRLGGGALPADETEKIARQLAAGLEYAHERGIVHRDLKPANIKIGSSGGVKILDFGLARAFDGPAGSSTTAAGDTVTMSQALTGANTVIGTAAYMSPEQTRGYEVDRRADIWAFGVILWEMLVGERLFQGDTASDVLAAVLRHEPEWDRMPADAPPILVALCRRCLERDPQSRLRDIGEARIALDGSGTSMVGARTQLIDSVKEAPTQPRSGRLQWALTGVFAAVAVAACYLGMSGALSPRAEPAPLVRSTVVLEQGQGLYLNPGNPGAPALSPDGRHLAFTAQDTSRGIMLAVRDLSSDEVRIIPGTSGAAYLFWGPDSRTVAFFAGGNLNRVDVGGGPVMAVCSTDNAKGGSWNADDRILYTASHADPIMMVDASGGEPVAVTDLADDENVRSHRFPCWLPDGEHFVYLAWFNSGGGNNETVLRVGSIAGGGSRDLMPCQTQAQYVDGHLIYVHEGNLMARPFSVADLEFSGPPRAIMGDVLALGAAHYGVFSATDAGVMTFVQRGGSYGDARLTWLDSANRETLLDRTRSLLGFELSPDGGRIAMSLVDDQQGSFDIWIHDIARSLATRLTFDQGSEMEPTWSPDGRWVYYSGDRQNRNAILRMPAAGGGRAEVACEGDDDVFLDDIAPDGATMAFTRMMRDPGPTVWLKDLTSEAEAVRFRDAPYASANARFSPDGRWLAYLSTETGQPEVFVESIAPDGGRWRLSANGGSRPIWSPGGDLVYYLEGTGVLKATEIVATDAGIAIGRTRSVASGVTTSLTTTYSVDEATGRILAQVPAQDELSDRIELVTGWQRLLDTGD
jgi:Tol biopolymer transport system component/tRNA A-37 threonylcarbamoyl transferase component Bud32